MNAYAYVGNSPLNLVDLLGLDPELRVKYTVIRQPGRNAFISAPARYSEYYVYVDSACHEKTIRRFHVPDVLPTVHFENGDITEGKAALEWNETVEITTQYYTKASDGSTCPCKETFGGGAYRSGMSPTAAWWHNLWARVGTGEPVKPSFKYIAPPPTQQEIQ